MQFASTMLIAAFHFPGRWGTPCGAEEVRRRNSGAGKQRWNQEYSRNTKKITQTTFFMQNHLPCNCMNSACCLESNASELLATAHNSIDIFKIWGTEIFWNWSQKSAWNLKRWQGDNFPGAGTALRAVTNHLWNVKSPSLSSNALITWSLNSSVSNEIRVPGNFKFTFHNMLFCSVVLSDLVQLLPKGHTKFIISSPNWVLL